MGKLIPFLVSVVLPFLSVDASSAADLAGQGITAKDKDRKGPEAPKKLDAPKSTDAPELRR